MVNLKFDVLPETSILSPIFAYISNNLLEYNQAYTYIQMKKHYGKSTRLEAVVHATSVSNDFHLFMSFLI